MDRTERLATALKQAFEPTRLSIDDDSHAHAGHRHDGGGHFTVAIASARFEGKSLVERHRMVYGAVADMMPAEIHALSIRAIAPSEEQV
ncbi:BolA family transcriptional regulator [Methylolobus aquaticus]|nr:BolA family transcriptional regulator [Methylolobus aquaticus]